MGFILHTRPGGGPRVPLHRLGARPEECIGSTWPALPKTETPHRVAVNSSSQIVFLLSCSEKERGAWELGVFWGVGKRNLQKTG